jgi:hypothetical protein
MEHIEGEHAANCWHCGRLTRFIEINFEAYLCPGDCTAAKWAAFQVA